MIIHLIIIIYMRRFVEAYFPVSLSWQIDTFSACFSSRKIPQQGSFHWIWICISGIEAWIGLFYQYNVFPEYGTIISLIYIERRKDLLCKVQWLMHGIELDWHRKKFKLVLKYRALLSEFASLFFSIGNHNKAFRSTITRTRKVAHCSFWVCVLVCVFHVYCMC